jgi:hypothetical protein
MAKTAIRRVPFTTDELAGMDVGSMAELDILSRLEAVKVQSLIRGDEYSSDYPAEPISDELKTYSFAETLSIKAGHCPNAWLPGSTTAGERFGKELFCGCEWCPVCGKPDSVAHNRRFESWLPKAQQITHFGQWVMEFALASRNKPRHRKALEMYGKAAVRVLSGQYEIDCRRYGQSIAAQIARGEIKAPGRATGEILKRGEVAEIKSKYPGARGGRRWHYFGDVKKELGKLGLKDMFTAEAEPDVLAPTVKSNVHLNCWTDSGRIDKPFLMHIVNSLRFAFNEPNLIVHYSHTDNPGRMVHALKYITRATFLDIQWDKWLAGQLFGFRNMRSWGKWVKVNKKTGKLPESAVAWALTEGNYSKDEAELMAKRRSVGSGVSYKTGLKISWSRPRPISELRSMEGVIELGSGYYELPDVTPPAEHIDASVPVYWQGIITKVLAEQAHKAEYERLLADIHAGAEVERKSEEQYADWVKDRFCPPVVSRDGFHPSVQNKLMEGG